MTRLFVRAAATAALAGGLALGVAAPAFAGPIGGQFCAGSSAGASITHNGTSYTCKADGAGVLRWLA